MDCEEVEEQVAVQTTVKRDGRIGKMLLFWRDQQGVPRIFIGPTYYFVAFLLFLCIFATFAFHMCLSQIHRLSFYYVLGGYMLVAMGHCCFVMCIIANPGIPQQVILRSAEVFAPDAMRDKSQFVDAAHMNGKYCQKCDYVRGPRDEHCNVCNVCIKGYDHHCVFYSKCIGSGNIIYFEASLAFIAIVAVYCFFLIIYQESLPVQN